MNEIKILMVDDDATVRSVFKEILTEEGFQVTQCVNGVDALKQVKTSADTFNLFMVDLEMPIMDGFRFIDMLRKIPKYQETPVIVLTGNSTERAVEKAIRLNIQDFLLKHSPKEEILSRVKTALEME